MDLLLVGLVVWCSVLTLALAGLAAGLWLLHGDVDDLLLDQVYVPCGDPDDEYDDRVSVSVHSDDEIDIPVTPTACGQ